MDQCTCITKQVLHVKDETGRWQKPTANPFNERKCTLCLKLKDGFHFLLECPLYKDLRKKYVKKYYWKNTYMLKFIELITSENETVINKLSMFVNKSFDLRINL